MAGPLAGIRVVELGVWVAAPAAGGILADWGADVIKIEPPGGDPGRTFQRMLGGHLDSNPPFEMDNRSKRSIVLDLGAEESRSVALELLADADVFLTNIRPAALRRLGLDFETVAAGNKRLVYGLITGYGETGPDADRAAYDVAAFWSRAGLAHLLTRPGDTPPFQRGGMGDHPAGMTLAAAVCAALIARDRTGSGQLVTTSLYRQGAYTVSFDLNTYLMTGHTIAIGQREAMGNPCMNNYAAADGRRFWIVGLQGDRHWPSLCRAVGHPDWLTDSRFADARSRAANSRELIAELDAIFATKPLDAWAEAFAAEPDFFWSPINTIEDVLADEQFHAGGGIVYVPDDDQVVPMVATPADFHGTPWEPRSRAPELGEHTDEVLAELRARRQSSPPAPSDLTSNDFPVLWPVTTRWADNDMFGHLNNAVYYQLFDTAINGWINTNVGVDPITMPSLGIVAESGCRYMSELHFPEQLVVGIAVTRLGRSSATYRLGVFRAGESGSEARPITALGHWVHVYVDRTSRKPVPIPDAIRALLATALCSPNANREQDRGDRRRRGLDHGDRRRLRVVSAVE